MLEVFFWIFEPKHNSAQIQLDKALKQQDADRAVIEWKRLKQALFLGFPVSALPKSCSQARKDVALSEEAVQGLDRQLKAKGQTPAASRAP